MKLIIYKTVFIAFVIVEGLFHPIKTQSNLSPNYDSLQKYVLITVPELSTYAHEKTINPFINFKAKINIHQKLDDINIETTNIKDSSLLKSVFNAINQITFNKPLYSKTDFEPSTYSFKLFWFRNSFKSHLPAQDFPDIESPSDWDNRLIKPDSSGYFTVVDEEAKFIGGEMAFIQLVRDSLRYPKRCIEAESGEYIELTFLVDLDGSVKKIMVAKHSKKCPEFELEALRVIQLTDRKWIPGSLNGNPVKSHRIVPIPMSINK